MSVPGTVLFIIAADFIHMGQPTIGAPFILSYLTVSIIQVSILWTEPVVRNCFLIVVIPDYATPLHCSRDYALDVEMEDRSGQCNNSVFDIAR
jgi:hypothetical protein